jgi:hypothetical protein
MRFLIQLSTKRRQLSLCGCAQHTGEIIDVTLRLELIRFLGMGSRANEKKQGEANGRAKRVQG